MKKISLVFLILMVLSFCLVPSIESRADGDPSLWPPGPDPEAIQSASAVVIDVETGTIVYEKAPTEAHFPASITKVMTALVALEHSSLDEVVTFSANAVYNLEKGSSSISRDVGEQMTMEECLYALLLESANEVATAIAEHVAGDVETFADMMNARAAEIGCVNTHFSNANGLHADDHYTCAYDMALISREAYKNPTFAIITGTKSYTIPPTNKHDDPTPLNNHHAMLNYYRTNQYLYEYCVGGKTGYTSKALATLVTYAKKDDFTLACVVMCASGNGHYLDTRALMDYFLDNMQNVKVNTLQDQLSELSGDSISSMMSRNEAPYRIDDNAVIFVPASVDRSKVEAVFTPEENQEGVSILGDITFSYGGKDVGKAEVYGVMLETYPFKSLMEEDTVEEPEDKPVLINIYFILIIAGVVVVAVIIIRLAVVRLGGAVTVLRRRRFENRDPHKNMRRIRRRRKNRNRWER